ncbi:hypothetical protein F5Y09DRAFT_109198 [Xylaria sp. FL1042]|nr:hypothetical protein F5Y09DRAFT_109198 [Xylaria sp. FL1042]
MMQTETKESEVKVRCWYQCEVIRKSSDESRFLFGRSRLSSRPPAEDNLLVVSAATLVTFVIAILVIARAAEASLLVIVVSILVVAAAAKAALVILVVTVLVVATSAKAQGLRARRESEGSHCDC